MAKKERYVMVCPKCKSTDVHTDYSNRLQPALGIPAMYVCSNCGHTGYTFPEVKLSELEGFEKKAGKEHMVDKKKDKSPLIDPSYGEFEVRAFWKISSIVLFAVGIILIFAAPAYGIALALLAAVMFYITYFMKRKLKG